MPTPSIKETISAHDEGEDLPRMGGRAVEASLFRKKPVVISAVQFTKAMAEGHSQLPEGVTFASRNLSADGRFPEYANDGKYLTNYSTCHRHYIDTLEGKMDVQIGDWVITGVNGERYPCKPDIFAATYEPAALSAAPQSDGWRPIAEALEGVLVVVGWLDPEDTEHPERHDFDYLEDGVWQQHSNNVEHFDMCAPPGSHGPKNEAPYTHFMRIAALPTTQTQGQNHGE